jgi:hypothetical protein
MLPRQAERERLVSAKSVMIFPLNAPLVVAQWRDHRT